MARHKARSIKSNLPFFNNEGEGLDASNLRRSFYPVVGKATVSKCRFHDLRHTFATRLVQTGVDLSRFRSRRATNRIA
jgi:site-specific recombinase XerD